MKLFRIMLAAAIAIAVLCCCKGNKNDNIDGKDVQKTLLQSDVQVKVQTLQLTPFNHEIISNGKLKANRKAELRFQSAEPIVNIAVKNGCYVNKGDFIAEVDKFKLESRLKYAKIQYERAQIEFHDLIISRGFSLVDSSNIPAPILKTTRIRSDYDRAEVDLEVARREYMATKLIAPFSGTVANLFNTEHNIASISEPFCTIIDNSILSVDFTILESELPMITENDEVEVYPYVESSIKATGRITSINPMVEKTGLVKIVASITNKNSRLYDGMNVKIKVKKQLNKQLVVPKTAVVLRDGKQVIFTYKDGKASWVYIATGMENSSSYIVTPLDENGLQPGDIVITEGNINLAHETPVTVIE